MRPARALKWPAKALAVVAAAGAAGTGLGVGLAALSGGDAGVQIGPVPATTSDERARTTASTTISTTPSARTAPAADRRPVRVKVLSAVLHPASTSLGRRRKRARLSVNVRVINGASSVRKPTEPALLASAAVVVGKVVGGRRGASLRDPLPPGARVQGRLRFETAGAVTTGIATTRRIRLRVAGVEVSTTRVKIGRPVAPPAPPAPPAQSTTTVAPQPPAARSPVIRPPAPPPPPQPTRPRDPQRPPQQTAPNDGSFESSG